MRKVLIGLVFIALLQQISFAHHSVAGFFDSNDLVEIEGVIRKVRWRNPHTVFLVDVTEASGEVTTWTVESGALGVLRSRGLAREFVQVGDRVKILGDNSLRSRPEMFARNMLLSNGKEVLHNISLKAKAGEKIALIGPSGSGKTTLLKVMRELYKPKKSIFILTINYLNTTLVQLVQKLL